MNLFGLQFDDGIKECLVCKCTFTPESPRHNPDIPVCVACIEKPINLQKLSTPEVKRQLIVGAVLGLFSELHRQPKRIAQRKKRARRRSLK